MEVIVLIPDIKWVNPEWISLIFLKILNDLEELRNENLKCV